MTDSFSLDGAPGSSAEQLKGIFKELKALDDELQAIHVQKREILAAAKLAGFFPPALTLVVRRSRKDPAAIAEGDVLVETYEAILGTGAGGAGTLTMQKNADGVFEPKMIQGGGPEAEEKLSRSQKQRLAAMTLGELAERAREGDAR